MTIRTKQTLLFLGLTAALGTLAYTTLDSMDEMWFYPVIIARVIGGLASFLCALYVMAGRRLPRSSGCLAFLALAVVESALCFLQGGSFGPSYAVVCVSLILSAASSDLDLISAFLAFLPSQALILAAPLLALPISTWFNIVHTVAALILPCITLACSAILWTVQAIASDRRSMRLMMRHLSQQQRLLQTRMAQPLVLYTAPSNIGSSNGETAVMENSNVTALPVIEAVPVSEQALGQAMHDLHSSHEAAQTAEQALYTDIISMVEAGVVDLRAQASSLILQGKKIPRIELQAMETLSIPVRVRVEEADFSRVLMSMLKRSLLSLNGENGSVRVSSRVGLHTVTIVIEDNGWGFREKFLQMKSSEKAAAQAQEAGMSLADAQKRLEFWGGRLEILSRLGVGSRVTLELERTDAYSSAPPQPEGPVSVEQSADH